jgi:hypothetical protein
MQQAHLELPMILHYQFTKENKHILRINTSDHSKMVINSPEVHLSTKRPHTKVGLKNVIIFGYKNHLGRLCINGNNSYKKIYILTLCNFWYRQS